MVFSELYFEPLNDDPNDEFVEIHNRSSQIVHLGDWRIDGGITFQFPPGTFLEPGKFLAISRNLTRLREFYPDLAPTPVVGNFDGALRNRGERLTLLRPVVVDPTPGPIPHVRYLAVEDDLTYVAGARVNFLSAGGSSSLERIDFEAPSSDPNLWRDRDESGRASWTSVESSGALTLTHPGVPSADQLQTLMLGPGEALVDDVEVLVNGNNWIANGRFETGTNGWVFQGTHRTSRVDPGAGPDGSRALHLVASDRGDQVANRIRTVLTSPIPVSAITTLRAKLRWLKRHPEILFRLRNGVLEAVGRLREPHAKNSFLYKPRQGRWQIFCWDFDVGLGVFNNPPTAALFDVGDPSIARMYRTPAIVSSDFALTSHGGADFNSTNPSDHGRYRRLV